MLVTKDFLMSVYERCHEHIKEQSSKRDQTIAFYLVILSFYIGSYASFTKMISSQHSAIFLNLVICMIGGMTIRTLSGLRSWHMQYTYSALVLNKILSREDFDLSTINQKIKDLFIEKNNKDKDMNFRTMLKGVENRVIFCMILISGFPVTILVKEILLSLKLNDQTITATAKILCYVIYVIFYLYNTRKVIRNSSIKPTWIVNFE